MFFCEIFTRKNTKTQKKIIVKLNLANKKALSQVEQSFSSCLCDVLSKPSCWVLPEPILVYSLSERMWASLPPSPRPPPVFPQLPQWFHLVLPASFSQTAPWQGRPAERPAASAHILSTENATNPIYIKGKFVFMSQTKFKRLLCCIDGCKKKKEKRKAAWINSATNL